MIAVVPVRSGQLPPGANEAVAEAGDRALLIGDGAADAAAELVGGTGPVSVCEQECFAPAAWSAGLAPWLADEPVVILPAGPDGRDLAPHLAHRLDRPLIAGAVRIGPTGATVARYDGLVMEELVTDGPFVATLVPGSRGVDRPGSGSDPGRPAAPPATVNLSAAGAAVADAELVEVTPADPATMDLAEAPRIVGGGAGLGSSEVMARLGAVATALGCSLGATRVATDWGWLPYERQIGTTGVAVNPTLYLAFGISGAVQHTAGLGTPEHVIAVNTDASCPMMAMADLALVTDAPALVAALARRLGVTP